MSIRIQDPLFLLSAQTGLSVGELRAKAAEGNPDIEKPQEALKTGEPIPIIFCRFRNSNGGVMVQPKMTEGFFANPFVETQVNDGSTTTVYTSQNLQIKYLLVLSEGDLPLIQIRDLFYGNSRRGTYNQKYNGRAGTWNPGNDIDSHYDVVVQPVGGVYYASAVLSLTSGQSLKAGPHVFYKQSDGSLVTFPYSENSFPAFCGTSGSYSGLTTLSFEYEVSDHKADKSTKTISAFIRGGLQVMRLVDSVAGESDNFVDLAKYLFQANDRLADDLIDNAALTTAAKFTDANGFLFNGELKESQNLLDWLQATSVNFLLRLSNSGGKFGLLPRLPYNTDFTIKTTQITPEFTFTEEHIVDGGFEIEYISLEDRDPVCFVVQWRQQPEADFGLVRTVQVRYTGEATNGPFVNVDMSSYCIDEDHAVKVGAFRLAQRKFVTHHLRLTVRERSYNSTLVVGDLVRVRLRRETSEGDAEYHDNVYEINRIEKTFASTIVYDLTHFPVDSQGRSIVAREVDAATGAGNTINVGRSTFDGDENSSSATTTVGTASGGGGTNQPATADTEVSLTPPSDSDTPYPAGESNPEDPLDETLDGSDSGNPQIQGYTDNPVNGDTLTYAPGCTGAFIEWFSVNKTTGERTSLGSGVGASLSVTTAMLQQGQHVVGVGRCPDPSAPDGYGSAIESNAVDWLPEPSQACLSSVVGCQQVSGGYGELQVNLTGAGFVDLSAATWGERATEIVSTSVYGPHPYRGYASIVSFMTVQNVATLDLAYNVAWTAAWFPTYAEAAAVTFRILPTSPGATCLNDCGS